MVIIFEWYQGNLSDCSGGVSSVLPVIPYLVGSEVDLDIGYYTVRALEVGSLCESAVEVVQVLDMRGDVSIRSVLLEGVSHCAVAV